MACEVKDYNSLKSAPRALSVAVPRPDATDDFSVSSSSQLPVPCQTSFVQSTSQSLVLADSAALVSVRLGAGTTKSEDLPSLKQSV